MTRSVNLAVHIECELGDEYFADWNNLSPAVQAFWNEATEQPHCEGSGNMGIWCNGCPFCHYFEVDDQ